MDLATVVGLAVGSALVLVTMLIAGSIMMFWDLTSIIIVLGGAAAATMIRWPLNVFLGAIKVGLKTVTNTVEDPNDLIKEIIELATTARKESILALEKVTIENRLLAKAVRYMVDGYDPKVINDIMDVEIFSMQQRHKDGRSIFENMAGACPAWGMIGTVIGLVVIMANLSDPSKIGPGLAVALITTLYGALIANLVFDPLASKLKYRSSEESTNMEIIREGVNAILTGQNPKAIQERLESFLPPQPKAE